MPNPIWISSALFLGYYMALGSYLPYNNLYYEQMGLSGVQIRILSSLPVLVASSTVLVWGISLLLDSVRSSARSLAGIFTKRPGWPGCSGLQACPRQPVLAYLCLVSTGGWKRRSRRSSQPDRTNDDRRTKIGV